MQGTSYNHIQDPLFFFFVFFFRTGHYSSDVLFIFGVHQKSLCLIKIYIYELYQFENISLPPYYVTR